MLSVRGLHSKIKTELPVFFMAIDRFLYRKCQFIYLTGIYALAIGLVIPCARNGSYKVISLCAFWCFVNETNHVPFAGNGSYEVHFGVLTPFSIIKNPEFIRHHAQVM